MNRLFRKKREGYCCCVFENRTEERLFSLFKGGGEEELKRRVSVLCEGDWRGDCVSGWVVEEEEVRARQTQQANTLFGHDHASSRSCFQRHRVPESLVSLRSAQGLEAGAEKEVKVL